MMTALAKTSEVSICVLSLPAHQPDSIIEPCLSADENLRGLLASNYACFPDGRLGATVVFYKEL